MSSPIGPRGKPLDAVEALEIARARGLKATLIVAHPVECPSVAPPASDVARFAATGALAPFGIDIDAFLGEGFGIAEAVALLGAPALCSAEPGSAYMNLHLAPRAPSLSEACLEIRDDQLIGAVIKVEPPALVDIIALSQRYGPPRAMPALHGPGADTFDHDTPSFRGLLMFERSDFADPASARRVPSVIYRRTSMIEILPAKFLTAEDLARLVRLALAPRAPDAVSFYGTLGALDAISGDRITFRPAVELRNVREASMQKRTVGTRHFSSSLEVKLAAPISADAAAVASAIGALLGVTPRVTTSGSAVRIDVPGGTIHVAPPDSAVSAIAIERAP
jgi:hypothetical protein